MPNDRLAAVALENLRQLTNLKYDAKQLEFAQRISQTLAKPVSLETVSQTADTSGEVNKGSTDVGDVSWVLPTAGFTTACFVPGTPAHSWQAVAAGGTSIGKQGMQLAAKTLAATAWDLYRNPEIIAAAKTEFSNRLSGRKYEPLLLPGQKPPLDYRNAPGP